LVARALPGGRMEAAVAPQASVSTACLVAETDFP
jgi:hypothetical protein